MFNVTAVSLHEKIVRRFLFSKYYNENKCFVKKRTPKKLKRIGGRNVVK